MSNSNSITKLLVTTVALIVLAMGVSVLGHSTSSAIKARLDEAVDKAAVRLDLVNALRARTHEMVASQRGVFVASVMNNPERVSHDEQKWAKATARIREQIAQLRPLLATQNSRDDINTVEATLSAYKPLAAEYMRLAKDHSFDATASVTEQLDPLLDRFDKLGASLIAEERKQLQQLKADAASVAAKGQIATVIAMLSVLICGVVAFVFVRSIATALRDVCRRLKEGAGQTANASNHLSSASQSLAQGSCEEASSLQETSASTEEINAMAQRNGENARAAADLAADSRSKFLQTSKILEDMVIAIDAAKSSSDDIAKIVKVIDGIAFQTNILALNAAVESARAGEAGLGFAVVAEEVRNLAHRCGKAAKDTSELIEESVSRSRASKVKVDEAALAVRSLAEESSQVTNLVSEVRTGSEEQLRGIEQIAKAVRMMEEVTQRNSATAEENAAAAEQLSSQSHSLREIAEDLAVMVG